MATMKSPCRWPVVVMGAARVLLGVWAWSGLRPCALALNVARAAILAAVAIRVRLAIARMRWVMMAQS